MEITEARQICQEFANKHKVVFEDGGEVGFGRNAVGFTHGMNYVDFNPLNRTTYEPIKEFYTKAVAPTDIVPDAYHKHDCLCVLVHGDDYETAIIQLAKWVKFFELRGNVKIVDYQTGATGLQIALSGLMGKCLVIENDNYAIPKEESVAG